MRPKISVIVPVYNAVNFLNNCLQSITKQTYSNLEIILVNDASNDDSSVICSEFQRRDQRIKVINKGKNEGISAARNTGLDAASGDLITFVDADDWFSEDEALEALYQTLVSNKSDIVVGNFNKFDMHQNGYMIYNHDLTVKSYLPQEWFAFQYDGRRNLNTCFIVPWGALCQRKVFADIRYPGDKIYEDDLTTWKTYLKANKITFLDQAIYIYRVNNRSSLMGHSHPNQWYSLGAIHERITMKKIIGFDISGDIESYDWRLFNHQTKDLDVGEISHFYQAKLNGEILNKYRH